MALTRRTLKALDIEEEKIDTIIEAHNETVSGLQKDLEKYKTDAQKLPDVQKELDDVKSDLEAVNKENYKEKYETVKKDFDDFKTKQAEKETHAAKEKAYRELLKSAGVSDKRIDAVLKVSNIDAVELDDKGAAKDANKLTESIKTEWADFIPADSTSGAETNTPPNKSSGTGQRTGRAAQIAAEYHKNLYGSAKEEK